LGGPNFAARHPSDTFMTGPSSDARMLDTASYTLHVSGDPRFAAVVRALAAKTAETAGLAPTDAARLADALGVIMDTVIKAVASPAAPDIMQVRFNVHADALRVVIAMEPPAGARAGWTLERELKARGHYGELRSLAPEVEFDVSGTHHICRLTCPHPQRS
jgi:hypothetical protein